MLGALDTARPSALLVRRTRIALMAVAGFLVVLVGATPVADAAGGPTITVQGDVHTSFLPAGDTPPEGITHVGTDLAGEKYRGVVGVEGTAPEEARVTLVLEEADADGDRRGVIVACTALDEVEPGHTSGDGPATDCSDAPEGQPTGGVWRFDITDLIGTPSSKGVVLVPVAGLLDGPYTVAFDQARTRLDVAGVAPPTTVPAVDAPPTAPPPAPDGLGPAASLAPIPPAPLPSLPPTGTATTAAASSDATAPPTDATVDQDSPDADPASLPTDRGRLVLVASAAGAAAAALFLPPAAFAPIARLARRRKKEPPVDAQTLVALNRRFRFLVGGAVAAAVVVLAAATATTENGDLMAGELASDPGESLLDPAGGLTPEDQTSGASHTVTDGTTTGGDPETGGNQGAADDGGTSPTGGDGQVAGPGGSPAPGGTAGTAQPLTATDQGVTAEAVRVATIDVAPQFYARFGIPDPQIGRVARAYAAEINDSGGIGGRRWEPVIVRVNDPTNEQQVTQACGQAFNDEKAFMMVNPVSYSGLADCAAKHGRILSDTGYGSLSAPTGEMLDRLGGRYWVAGMASHRLVVAWVDLIETTYGADTKIGIAETDDPALTAVSKQFQDELVRRGFPKPTVVHTQQDPSTAAVQINNAIARYRQDGVQLIAPLLNPVAIGLFQNAAEGNGYRPEHGYTFSSFAGLDNQDYEAFFNRRQMNGAIGVSLFRPIDAPQQQQCRNILSARDPEVRFSAAAGLVCHTMFLNRRVMESAGAELTAATWAQSFGALGSYDGNAFGRSTFSPAKRGGADQYRIMRFQNGFVGDNTFHSVGGS